MSENDGTCIRTAREISSTGSTEPLENVGRQLPRLRITNCQEPHHIVAVRTGSMPVGDQTVWRLISATVLRLLPFVLLPTASKRPVDRTGTSYGKIAHGVLCTGVRSFSYFRYILEDGFFIKFSSRHKMSEVIKNCLPKFRHFPENSRK